MRVGESSDLFERLVQKVGKKMKLLDLCRDNEALIFCLLLLVCALCAGKF
jgi:hypothetical protein